MDLGCGTGRFAAALRERHGCEVVGVDPSPGMLAVARDRDAGVRWIEGCAEAIPLEDEAVERAVMQTVVHLVEDRDAACAEFRRVVGPAGTAAIHAVDPAGAERFWMADLMPSWAAIDEARFPAPNALAAEFSAAGSGSRGSRRRCACATPVTQAAHLIRERFGILAAPHLRRRARGRRAPGGAHLPPDLRTGTGDGPGGCNSRDCPLTSLMLCGLSVAVTGGVSVRVALPAARSLLGHRGRGGPASLVVGRIFSDSDAYPAQNYGSQHVANEIPLGGFRSVRDVGADTLLLDDQTTPRAPPTRRTERH